MKKKDSPHHLWLGLTGIEARAAAESPAPFAVPRTDGVSHSGSSPVMIPRARSGHKMVPTVRVPGFYLQATWQASLPGRSVRALVWCLRRYIPPERQCTRSPDDLETTELSDKWKLSTERFRAKGARTREESNCLKSVRCWVDRAESLLAHRLLTPQRMVLGRRMDSRMRHKAALKYWKLTDRHHLISDPPASGAGPTAIRRSPGECRPRAQRGTRYHWKLWGMFRGMESGWRDLLPPAP